MPVCSNIQSSERKKIEAEIVGTNQIMSEVWYGMYMHKCNNEARYDNGKEKCHLR
jgi:hypothetical protein